MSYKQKHYFKQGLVWYISTEKELTLGMTEKFQKKPDASQTTDYEKNNRNYNSTHF